MQQDVFSWRQAIQKSSLASTTRLVLLNLSIHMNDIGEGCFPSVETQAKCTGLTKRAVLTHIESAIIAGFLTKEQHGYAGQQWKRNEYFASFPRDYVLQSATSRMAMERGEPNTPPLPEGGERGSEGGERSDKKVVKDVHPNKPINSTKKINNKISLSQWEQNLGCQLCIDQMRHWIGENGIMPESAKELVKEFREKVTAGGNRYADFVAAFKVWLRSGYLSKKIDEIKYPTQADPKFRVHTKGTYL